jgi:hypothetical protein
MRDLLFNRWVFSEESEGVKTYRPSARFSEKKQGREEQRRHGFEIKKNGEFIIYTERDSGMPVENVGRYEVKGDTVYVYFPDHYSDIMFTLKSVDKDSLKIIL